MPLLSISPWELLIKAYFWHHLITVQYHRWGKFIHQFARFFCRYSWKMPKGQNHLKRRFDSHFGALRYRVGYRGLINCCTRSLRPKLAKKMSRSNQAWEDGPCFSTVASGEMAPDKRHDGRPNSDIYWSERHRATNGAVLFYCPTVLSYWSVVFLSLQ